MKQDNKEFKFKDFPFNIYIGIDRKTGYKIYLNGFSWDCNGYYGGGYLSYYNKIGRPALQIQTHFNIAFLDNIIKNNQSALWFSLSDIVNDAQFNSNEWWRIKDLYCQFYALKKAADVFKYGGHCTSQGRNKKEINLDMNYKINEHIQDIIIPEIMKALKVKINYFNSMVNINIEQY